MRPIPRLLFVLVLAIPLLAVDCEESSVAPLRLGSIQGRVTADGASVEGVTVGVAAGATRTTDASGNYRFENLAEGTYTVFIAGFPSDVEFAETSQRVTIGDPDLSVTVNFEGTVLRNAAIVGNVTLAGDPLIGVTVRATGPGGTATATTGEGGEYGIGDLAAGAYAVSVDAPAGVACDPASTTVTLEGDETRVVLFTCSNAP